MDVVTSFGESEIQSQGVAFHATGVMFLRPFFNKKGNFEKFWRWSSSGMKIETVPRRRILEKVDDFVIIIDL